MPRIQLIVIGLAVTVLLGIFGYMKLEISHLQSTVDKLQKEVQLRQTNLNMCKASRAVQTQQIEDLRIDYDSKLSKYNKLLSSKPKIRYKTIYRNIIRDINITDEGCKNVKQFIDNIRNTDPDSI